MKFPMLVPCTKCGKKTSVQTTGDQRFPDLNCECGSSIWIVSSDIRVSRRVYMRADYELRNNDFSLAIILSAMSVECELAFLFSKWKEIDAGLVPSEVTDAKAELWEREFQKLPGGAGGKLDACTKQMTGETFDGFLTRRTELLTGLKTRHTGIGNATPKAFFIRELFRKRNKILHSGAMQFGEPDADACVNMALSLLQVINEIDRERIARLV